MQQHRLRGGASGSGCISMHGCVGQLAVQQLPVTTLSAPESIPSTPQFVNEPRLYLSPVASEHTTAGERRERGGRAGRQAVWPAHFLAPACRCLLLQAIASELCRPFFRPPNCVRPCMLSPPASWQTLASQIARSMRRWGSMCCRSCRRCLRMRTQCRCECARVWHCPRMPNGCAVLEDEAPLLLELALLGCLPSTVVSAAVLAPQGVPRRRVPLFSALRHSGSPAVRMHRTDVHVASCFHCSYALKLLGALLEFNRRWVADVAAAGLAGRWGAAG